MALRKLCPHDGQCNPRDESLPSVELTLQNVLLYVSPSHLRPTMFGGSTFLYVPAFRTALFETPHLSGAWTCAEPNGRLWAGNAQHAKAGLRADGLPDVLDSVPSGDDGTLPLGWLVILKLSHDTKETYTCSKFPNTSLKEVSLPLDDQFVL